MATKKEYSSRQYFFWNGDPYKVISESRRKNVLVAWDIKNKKRVSLPWTEWRRHRKKAYITSQVAAIFNRNHIRVRLWLADGLIPYPFKIESVDGDKREFGNTKINMLWSEEDLWRVHEYLESTGRSDFPSRAELQAIINNDQLIQFIQDENGEFIPVWTAGV